MKHYDLSEDTTVILNDDGSMTLEVLVDDDIAAVFLTAIEVARLKMVLKETEAQP